MEGAKERIKSWGVLGTESQMVAITWSPQFDIYNCNFSWGKPQKIEISSVNRKMNFLDGVQRWKWRFRDRNVELMIWVIKLASFQSVLVPTIPTVSPPTTTAVPRSVTDAEPIFATADTSSAPTQEPNGSLFDSYFHIATGFTPIGEFDDVATCRAAVFLVGVVLWFEAVF
ncbi:hypothetical protein F8388_010125 [Cannabis sativa]|uniref:Uncharacterized protein n=1 Tax=Cannabis sativa TaxID=3483 RepID=A0A7J6GU30_CANSA|nr:hypothetical protein F8388_010125 [Cannabis sativa]